MISRLNAARLQFDIMHVAARSSPPHDSNDATAIDSVDDDTFIPVSTAHNPDIVPFKNVSLAVIRKFYQEGFKDINGHLLYRILPEQAYADADEWLRQSISSSALPRASNAWGTKSQH